MDCGETEIPFFNFFVFTHTYTYRQIQAKVLKRRFQLELFEWIENKIEILTQTVSSLCLAKKNIII